MQVAVIDADSICYLLNWQIMKLSESVAITPSKIFNLTNQMTDSIVENIPKLTNIEYHFTHGGKNDEIFRKAYKRTARTQFRKELGGTYKHNRAETEMPYYTQILECLMRTGTAFIHDLWEADDAVVLRKKLSPTTCTVLANDKDVLKQCAGKHFMYDRRKQWLSTTAEEANKFRFVQAITGDPTDGYSGIPKVGKAGAEKVLYRITDPVERWAAIEAAYKKAGLTAEDAVRNMRMADMHQLSPEGGLRLFNPKDVHDAYP